ncbi:hypothetical protein AQUCO_00700172v1 [Aquilegia coerulea]|uniref:Uncharacterized protein n=1 Tax=Aquilegia coerulea TaxID=218851 RepID=A0A2G5EIZ6_AQUCA|nr:hypothetical protein AQUCO_00700172v1 [Aquilegia coerulea]
MRKLCPNYDREDGLETVLEVPIPDEFFASTGTNSAIICQNMHQWIKNHSMAKLATQTNVGRNAELHLLLNVVGSPLIPLQVQLEHPVHYTFKDCSIEASTAKYIVQQYIAAVGGQQALSAVHSMAIMGEVKMSASEFRPGDENVRMRGSGEIGGFVLWQKNPNLWYLELVVSGCKVSAGSDGKVTWRQLATQQSHATKGPPRPLRRFLQGLDPRATANLFSDAVCIGEKTIKNEDCFILKLDVSPTTLKARSSNNFEIIHHTIWGYFSQRSGLLIQFEDSHLVRMSARGEDIFWETSMESVIDDYRYVDAINVAHSGTTTVTLFRYGAGSANHKRRMEETWKIEEVDFNVWGLSMDSFLPPADLKREQDNEQVMG